jgi:hypothetical protein
MNPLNSPLAPHPGQQADPFDDFDFKPMTDGLGFHKKADKLKKDILLSNLGEDAAASRTVPDRPPAELRELAGGADDRSASLLADEDGPRKASQSISELIASLPPSLDFLDDKEDAADAGLSPSNPYIARTFSPPRARDAGGGKSRSSRRGANLGAGIGAAFSSSSGADEILPSVSAAAQSAASLFGELAGPRAGALPSAPAKPSASIGAQVGPQISSASGPSPAHGSAKIFQPLPREDYAPPLAPPRPTLATGVGAPLAGGMARASSSSLGGTVPGAMSGSGQNSLSAPLPPGPVPAAPKSSAKPSPKAGAKSGSMAGVAAAASAAPAMGGGAALRAPLAPMPYADKIKDEFSRAFPSAVGRKRRIETPASELEPVSTSFASAALDAMAVGGLTSLFLVCVLAITKADLIGLLTNAQTDQATQAHLALLFIAVLTLYALVGRSFFGATLGEWAFDIQLGDGDDQRKVLYPARALARSLVVTLTGFALIPLLSFIVKKDLSKLVSGLQLYRRP